jgi:hypothetical protein
MVPGKAVFNDTGNEAVILLDGIVIDSNCGF